MKIAAATYTPEWHADWAGLEAKLRHWVQQAAGAGARLLVFPEYAGIEAALIGSDLTDDPQHWRDRMAVREAQWRDLHLELASEAGVHILAGSLCAEGTGGPVNRAWLCGPQDAVAQDKLIPTPFERNFMQITGGDGLILADTPHGRLGILICYDSEFPLLARVLVAGGADAILVPSCTDFPAGQTRVRQSCRARAIEGQILVVQAPLAGEVPACTVTDHSVGRAGVFVPPDHGMPPNGIVAQGRKNRAGWTYATVDPGAIGRTRVQGQVGNAAHWPEQDTKASLIGTLPCN